MRTLVVEALRRDGYEVTDVADGGQLLAWIQASGPVPRFDLIVSDIRLPHCSGLSVLATVRRAQWALPVVLMTAFSDPETRRLVESLGAILFDKPFALDDLRTAVANLLPSS